MGFFSDQIKAYRFRAAFSTFANESGLWAYVIVERALAHIEGNEVCREYARDEPWGERIKVAGWWAGESNRSQFEGRVQ